MASSNLDLKCAVAAEEIIGQLPAGIKRQDVEKLCVDASAVLAENGPYAFFLYLWARSSKDQKNQRTTPSFKVLQGTFGLLGQVFPTLSSGTAEDRLTMLKRIASLSENLNDLLLAKKVLLQAMTYSRYHAKALPKG